MSFTFKEEHGNLFEVSDKYYLAHCVSTDCALGAGIAVQFQKRFKLKESLKASAITGWLDSARWDVKVKLCLLMKMPGVNKHEFNDEDCF